MRRERELDCVKSQSLCSLRSFVQVISFQNRKKGMFAKGWEPSNHASLHWNRALPLFGSLDGIWAVSQNLPWSHLCEVVDQTDMSLCHSFGWARPFPVWERSKFGYGHARRETMGIWRPHADAPASALISRCFLTRFPTCVQKEEHAVRVWNLCSSLIFVSFHVLYDRAHVCTCAFKKKKKKKTWKKNRRLSDRSSFDPPLLFWFEYCLKKS